MVMLIIGLAIFFAAHSLPMMVDRRSALHARFGEKGYKLAFSIVSLVGFILLVIGYGEARWTSSVLWDPPVCTRHLAALLMLIAFILLAAAYVPAGKIKGRVKHPMVASIKIWAFAHLLANGTMADLLLFGSFLAYAVITRISLKRREVAGLISIPSGPIRNDMIALVVGVVAYVIFVAKLHVILIGVAPFS